MAKKRRCFGIFENANMMEVSELISDIEENLEFPPLHCRSRGCPCSWRLEELKQNLSLMLC